MALRAERRAHRPTGARDISSSLDLELDLQLHDDQSCFSTLDHPHHGADAADPAANAIITFGNANGTPLAMHAVGNGNGTDGAELFVPVEDAVADIISGTFGDKRLRMDTVHHLHLIFWRTLFQRVALCPIIDISIVGDWNPTTCSDQLRSSTVTPPIAKTRPWRATSIALCIIGVASFNVGVDPRRMRGRSTSFKAKLAMTLLYRAFVFWLLARAPWSDLRVVLGSTYLWPLWGPVMCGANPCDDGLSQVMLPIHTIAPAVWLWLAVRVHHRFMVKQHAIQMRQQEDSRGTKTLFWDLRHDTYEPNVCVEGKALYMRFGVLAHDGSFIRKRQRLRRIAFNVLALSLLAILSVPARFTTWQMCPQFLWFCDNPDGWNWHVQESSDFMAWEGAVSEVVGTVCIALGTLFVADVCNFSEGLCYDFKEQLLLARDKKFVAGHEQGPMDEETGQPVDIPVSACNILVMYRRLWDDARGMDHLLGTITSVILVAICTGAGMLISACTVQWKHQPMPNWRATWLLLLVPQTMVASAFVHCTMRYNGKYKHLSRFIHAAMLNTNCFTGLSYQDRTFIIQYTSNTPVLTALGVPVTRDAFGRLGYPLILAAYTVSHLVAVKHDGGASAVPCNYTAT